MAFPRPSLCFAVREPVFVGCVWWLVRRSCRIRSSSWTRSKKELKSGQKHVLPAAAAANFVQRVSVSRVSEATIESFLVGFWPLCFAVRQPFLWGVSGGWCVEAAGSGAAAGAGAKS